jgi:predicted outer membrane repeat protein
MSLKLLTPGIQPLGCFDVLDTELTSIKGGEVVTLTSVLNTNATDKAASDVFDGYTLPSSLQKRPVVTKTLSSGKRPLMLADDGIAGYGTLFGTVVGGTVGQVVNGGAVLGPHSSTGSGKLTCWDKPGLYAVSLDAVDTTSSTGLVTNNTSLDSGSALYATSAGLLTPNSGAAFESVVVGRFVSFDTNGSLVTTPNKLVTALNSPTGSAETTRQFAFATFFFTPNV